MEERLRAVLFTSGGIAGIQAALDLGDVRIMVHQGGLSER